MKVSYITLIGSSSIALLLIIFAYLYWAAIPGSGEINPSPIIRLPNVDNQALEGQLKGLKKVDGLPIQVDPNDLGKENPYF